jgi:hypothetical protein
MGFNKRYVDYLTTLSALKSNDLKSYYEKTDVFIFQDDESEKIYKLFVNGKTEKEILKLINH